jgi:methylmalonyl-CoA mutase
LAFASVVIPQKDYDYLFDSGVAAVFGPGASIPIASQEVLSFLIDGYR